MKRQPKLYGERCTTCRGPHDPVEHADRLAIRRRTYDRRASYRRLRGSRDRRS